MKIEEWRGVWNPTLHCTLGALIPPLFFLFFPPQTLALLPHWTCGAAKTQQRWLWFYLEASLQIRPIKLHFLITSAKSPTSPLQPVPTKQQEKKTKNSSMLKIKNQALDTAMLFQFFTRSRSWSPCVAPHRPIGHMTTQQVWFQSSFMQLLNVFLTLDNEGTVGINV